MVCNWVLYYLLSGFLWVLLGGGGFSSIIYILFCDGTELGILGYLSMQMAGRELGT